MAAFLNEALIVLRLNQVKERTGMSRSFIYKLMSEGKFPRSIRLGKRSVGWYAHAVNDFLASRAETK